jgi:hypothetical protein
MGDSTLGKEEINSLLRGEKLVQVGPYLGAGKPIECKCLECGKTVSPRISSIKRGHKGCKYCAAKARSQSRKVPDDSARAVMIQAGVNPLEPYTKTSHPWRSECLTCGEEVSPQYANVIQGHKACKFCAGKAISDVKATSIYLTSGAKPLVPFTRTNAPWEGVCLGCGGKVAPRLDDLKQGQGACIPCGRDIASSKQRLTEEEAVLRLLAVGAEPIEPWGNKKIDDPWLSRCLNCDQIITPSVHAISNGQGPCIHCGRRAAAEKKTHSNSEAVRIIEGLGFEALEEYVSATTPWLTRCTKCGSKAQRRFANIQFGMGCRECASEARRISPDSAVEKMRASGWEPLEPFVATREPWKCRCLNCHKESYKILRHLGNVPIGGCLYCSERTLGSIFYFVHHAELRAFKVGVGKEKRIDSHLGKGWKLISSWDLETPVSAYSLEKEVLTYVREMWGLPQWLGNEEMPQKGATETFTDSEFGPTEVCQLIEKIKVKI